MYDETLGAQAPAFINRILAIEFPRDQELRWRKIVRRSGARPTGKYPSWKMRRMLQWESPHELNAFRLLDADPTIKAFDEQPVRITYALNGKVQHHIPDILVQTQNGKAFWEIKTIAFATEADVLERTRFLERHLPTEGYEYRVVLAEDLAKQPMMASVCQVLYFGRGDISLEDRETIRNLFALAPSPITWGHVVDGLFGKQGRHQICRLMLEGWLAWNPDTPLTRDTVIAVRLQAELADLLVEA